jgi:hypothetical protein
MKQRLVTVFTLLALVGGSGGALAIAGSGGSGQVHSAASGQYKPGQRCGKHKNQPCPTHRGPCIYKGHYHKHCPVPGSTKGVHYRYPHSFACHYHDHYYKQCPYGRSVKGVHAVKKHRHVKAAFTG